MDDGSSNLPWIAALILLVCAMYCAFTETAFASSSRPRLKAMAEGGSKKAVTALKILDEFDRAITTILIMTNIVHISAASIVTVAVTKRFGIGAVTLSTIVTSVIVFFAGEMLPKSIAKKNPESFAMSTAASLRFFITVFYPLSSLLAAIGSGVSSFVKGEPELSVTEDELYDIIEDMTEEGTLDEEQGDLISSAIQFADLTVESILTPRVDMVAVNEESSLEEILSVIKSCTHSRLPVYSGSIDNITGILSIRTFIKAYIKDSQHLILSSLLVKPFFIYQGTKLDDVLPLMTKNRQTLAIVTDNYGGTLGLVTVEDLLEELVGDIWDEEDVVEERIVSLGDNRYSVDADEKVSDVFEEIEYEDPEDDEELVNTVMGAWAYENFNAIPNTGDSFDYHNLHVAVSEMSHNRIVRLILEILPTENEGGEER